MNYTRISADSHVGKFYGLIKYPAQIMWGSDFPHPDGVWRDSREYIAREMPHVPTDVRRKIVCGNATRLYNVAA